MTGISDGYQQNLVDFYDGLAAQVIAYGPAHAPDTTLLVVDDVTDELGRVDVELTATLVDGEVLISFADAEVDIDGAEVAGGWWLAHDGADATARLLAWFDDPGGFPPDPYPVVLTNYAIRSKRPD